MHVGLHSDILYRVYIATIAAKFFPEFILDFQKDAQLIHCLI